MLPPAFGLLEQQRDAYFPLFLGAAMSRNASTATKILTGCTNLSQRGMGPGEHVCSALDTLDGMGK